MADEIQQELLNRFDELTDSLKNISNEYGSQAIEAITTALYIDAVFTIIAKTFVVIVFTIIGLIFYKEAKNPKNGFDGAFFLMAGALISFGIAISTMIFGVLEPSSWTTLYSPEAGIARKLIGF